MKKRDRKRMPEETVEIKGRNIWNILVITSISIFLFLRFFVDGMSYPEFNFFWNILFFTLLIVQLLRDRLKNSYSKEDVLLLLFFLFSAISSGISPIRGTGIVFNAQLLVYWCLFFLIARNFRLNDTEIIFYIILISGLCIILYGVYQYFWGLEQTRQFVYSQPAILKNLPPTFLQKIESNRIFATFVYPNVFASFLLFLLPLSFFPILFRDKLPVRILCFVILSLSFYNLLLTGSFGGILIFLFIAQIILLFLLFGNTKKFRLILSVVIFFEILLFSGGYFIGKLPKISSFTDRLRYWRASVSVFYESPILGVGTENYRYLYTKFKPPGGMEAKHPHSMFFATLAETGIAGTFFLFTFLMTVSIKLFKASRLSPFFMGLGFSFFAFFLHNLIDFSFINPSAAVLFFISGGLVAAVDKKEKMDYFHPLTKWFSCLILITVVFTGIGYTRCFLADRSLLQAQKERDVNNSLYYLGRAKRLCPDNFEIYNTEGDIFYKLFFLTNKPVYKKSAENSYLYVLSLNPRLSSVYRKMALFYEKTGVNESAERMYLNLLNTYPNKKQYNLEIALFYKKIGNEEAYRHYYVISKGLPAVTIEESIITEGYEKWIKSQK
jgi:hypothetical protein